MSQFNTKKRQFNQPFSSTQKDFCSTSTPQFNTLVSHKSHTFSAPKIPQFHTRNPFSSTPPPSVPMRGFWCETEVDVLNWGGCAELRGFWCGTEGVFRVELRGFSCGTDGFLVWNLGKWNSGVFGVELREMCWTEGFLEWNRGGCVKLRGFWCGT